MEKLKRKRKGTGVREESVGEAGRVSLGVGVDVMCELGRSSRHEHQLVFTTTSSSLSQTEIQQQQKNNK